MTFKIRTVAPVLVAMVALTATAASSAFATLPEFKPVPSKKHFTSTSGPFRISTLVLLC